MSEAVVTIFAGGGGSVSFNPSLTDLTLQVN
jgi:hypothetical protein